MKKRHQVLLVLSLLSMITFLDRVALSSASSNIMETLHINTKQWGWILGMFTLAYASFEIPTGWLGDRFGGKKILIRVVLWWSLFTILTGLAAGFVMLLMVRFLFGVGEAGAYPNTSIILSKWFPVLERGRAQATIWGASRIGAALTPFIVLPIQQKFSWHISFYTLGFVGLVWVLFFIFWQKEDPSQSKTISAEELKHILDNRDLPIHTQNEKTSFWSGFQNPNLGFLLGMYVCYAVGAYFFQSWFHTYLEKGRQMSAHQLIWASSVPYLLAAGGCFVGGWLSDKACLKYGKKWGRRIVPMVGLFVAGLCMICAALVTNNLTCIVLLGMGMAFMDLTAPVAWAVAMDMGGTKSGTVSGAMNSAGLLGAYLSTVVFGYIAEIYGYYLPVLSIGVIVFSGSFIWLKIDATQKIEFRKISTL